MPLPLETERLLIRRFEPGDVEDHFEYLSDPGVARYEYWEPYSSLDAVRQMNDAERVVEPGEEARRLELAVVLRSESKVIGCVGIKILSRQHRFGEVGWTLNPRYQGRGYATEAANAVLQFGFEELDLYWLTTFCHVHNEPSWRLMERLGMRRLAHLERNSFTKGEWWDEFVYSILAPEWRLSSGAVQTQETE